MPARRWAHFYILWHGMQTRCYSGLPLLTQLDEQKLVVQRQLVHERTQAVQQLLSSLHKARNTRRDMSHHITYTQKWRMKQISWLLCTLHTKQMLRLVCHGCADIRSVRWDDCWSSDSRCGSHAGGPSPVHHLQEAPLTQQACLHGSQGHCWQDQRVSAPVLVACLMYIPPRFLLCICC